jgi:hypothetical protein
MVQSSFLGGVAIAAFSAAGVLAQPFQPHSGIAPLGSLRTRAVQHHHALCAGACLPVSQHNCCCIAHPWHHMPACFALSAASSRLRRTPHPAMHHLHAVRTGGCAHAGKARAGNSAAPHPDPQSTTCKHGRTGGCVQANEARAGAAARGYKGGISDKDIIDFLVNVECLEGLFDTWGVFGQARSVPRGMPVQSSCAGAACSSLQAVRLSRVAPLIPLLLRILRRNH